MLEWMLVWKTQVQKCRELVKSLQFNIISASKKKSKGKPPILTVDKSYLACQHHIAMVTGIGMIQNEDFDELLGSFSPQSKEINFSNKTAVCSVLIS